MTSWRDVPPVEPLSDLSWKRIERGVFDQLEGRADHGDRAVVEGAAAAGTAARRARRWPRLAAAGAVCAAAAALLLLVRGSDTGDAERADVAGQPSRVATAESPVEITVGRASLTIAPQSAVWVSGDDHRGVSVILERGEVACAVAYRADQPPLTVQAGDVRVEVVGTQFAVSRHGDDVRVSVTRGVVEVIARGAVARVEAGQAWATGALPERAGDDAAGEAGAAGTGDTTDHAAGADSARGASAAERGETPTRSAGGHRRGHTSRVVGPATAREGVSDRDRESRARSARERFEAAARLEARDPAAAIAIYRELAEAGGPWAANALFGQARLELERGRRAAARALLRSYLRKYPRGANAADARALLAR